MPGPVPLLRDESYARAQKFLYKPKGPKVSSRKSASTEGEKSQRSVRQSPRQQASPQKSKAEQSAKGSPSSSTPGGAAQPLASEQVESATKSSSATPRLGETPRLANSDKKRRTARRRGKAKDPPSAFDDIESIDEGQKEAQNAAIETIAAGSIASSLEAAGALESLVARLEAEVARLQLENSRLATQGSGDGAPAAPPPVVVTANPDAPSITGAVQMEPSPSQTASPVLSPALSSSAAASQAPSPAPVPPQAGEAVNPGMLARARSFSSAAASAASAAEEASAQLREENAKLRAEAQALREEMSGLQAEVTALRSLVVNPPPSAEVASAIKAAEDEAAAAKAEAHRLGEENSRLLRRLSTIGEPPNPDMPEAGGNGSGTSGGARPSLVRKETIRPNPVKEKALFAAVGYSVDTKGYRKADLVALRELLESGEVNLNCRDGKGSPPLAHAAWTGDEDALLLLLAHGADLDAENLDGATPLHFTVFNRQAKAAALLVAAGADFSLAQDDAAAVGSPEVKAIFQGAAQAGREHPMLKAAAIRVDKMRVQS